MIILYMSVIFFSDQIFVIMFCLNMQPQVETKVVYSVVLRCDSSHCCISLEPRQLQKYQQYSTSVLCFGRQSMYVCTYVVVYTLPLCMIFMILVSLENVKKYSHVVARLPQRLKSTLFEIFSNGGWPKVTRRSVEKKFQTTH